MSKTQITMNLSARLVCLLLLLASVSSVFAQANYKGQVVDETGIPLVGANVIVAGAKSGTITDSNGDFTIVA